MEGWDLLNLVGAGAGGGCKVQNVSRVRQRSISLLEGYLGVLSSKDTYLLRSVTAALHPKRK